MPKRKPAKKTTTKRKPAVEPTRRETILAILRRQRDAVTDRAELHQRVRQRGVTRSPKKGDGDLEFPIPTSGGSLVLNGIARGRLEVVTTPMLDALIAELSNAT